MGFETDNSIVSVSGFGSKKSRNVFLVLCVPFIVIILSFQLFFGLTFRPDQTSQIYEVLELQNILRDFKIKNMVSARRTNHTSGTSTENESKPDTRTAYKLVPTANISGNSSTIDSKQGIQGTRPLNVIVFFPDDMSHKSLQDVSGPDYVETPFLSALAKDGIRFARNAVTTSVCWMSRATLFTGLYSSSHGSHRLYCPRFTLPQYWKDTWVSLLQRVGGYYVGHVGKWQYSNRFPQLLFNFTRMYAGSHFARDRKTGKKIAASDKAMQDAIKFLEERPKDRPFALTVAFYPPKAVGQSYEPGGQWTPKESVKKRYANRTYLPPYNLEEAYNKLPLYLRRGPWRLRYLERWNSTEKYIQGMRNYNALVTQVDAACKGIVDVLKEKNLYENTLIIFTSDNGLMMGSHGIAGKWLAYEESIRVPLIIYDPRMPAKRKGSVEDRITLNVDLAATILGAANIDPPSIMQGRDIADLYLDEKAKSPVEKEPWRTDFFYEFPVQDRELIENYAVIGEQYKYMKYPGYFKEQLFDLTTDPYELNDISGKNETKGVLQELRKRYDLLREELLSPGKEKRDWCKRKLPYP